ncbi:hypothetical protein [Actinomadura madurae]|uniref:hypothetical protein n=1 Tax=Actinomadura madurae TaxID=1993 RepID=UPI0020D1F6A5|nr:hypothetical protein [Actinomadura madurae]MCP9951421.1 hypothetical protein [Actinomadura madurae]MCP9968194.1 hypothetical protein [Actinomadura madurae]MCP9980651.1 hypothetical protein [Actinomadura madurae]MCQ0016850.1 hypothetical protein [Actinomadura madurae]
MTTISTAYAALPRRPLRASAVKRCPSCRNPLDGGPVHFRCEPCGRSVMAADLDTEYHPTRHHDDQSGDGAHPVAAPTDREGRRTA